MVSPPFERLCRRTSGTKSHPEGWIALKLDFSMVHVLVLLCEEGRVSLSVCLSVCLFYSSIICLSALLKEGKLPLVSCHGFEEVFKEKRRQIKNVGFEQKWIQIRQHRI